jgi:hypothetical protein
VVVDLRPRLEDGVDRVLVALEVGDEHLDRASGKLLVDLPDGLGENVRPKVGEVIAIDRRDDGVAETQLGDRRCDAPRLGDVVLRRTAVRDGAVSAVPRAGVAEDHEGGGAVIPALAEVRAMRFLAHRVEVELAHEPLQAGVHLAAWSLHLQPRRLSLGERLGAVAAHDLIKHLAHLAGSADRGARRREQRPRRTQDATDWKPII